MNETILNGLLNLFAVFASAVRIEEQQASRAVHLFVYSLSGGLTSKSLLTMAQVSFS